MGRRKHQSGATAGRKIFRVWSLGPFEYRSDLISHDYMRRWTLFTPWGMLRLHHILRGDSREHLHDHPMDFASLILKGGYVEYRPNREPRTFKPGSVVVRKAEDLHALEMLDGDAWTLVLASPVRRDWGFATEEGWVSAGQYDSWKAKRDQKGAMQCES